MFSNLDFTVKKERAIQMVTLDPHGPNELRCNGTLSNVAEFLEVGKGGRVDVQ